MARSLAHLEEAHKVLLAQTDRAAALLVDVGPKVLQDVFTRVVEQQLAGELQKVEGDFATKHAQSQAAAARHRAKLKPALASRPDASVVALRQKEDTRWARSVERIRQFRAEVLELLQSNGRSLSRQLLHASSSLLAECDSLVLPLDLINVLRDGGAVLGGRSNISQLAKEARRLRLTKEAVAEQAGMALDALGNLVPKDPAAAAASTSAVTSPTAAGGKQPRVSSASRKKTAAQLDAERAANEAAQKASAELAAKMDPRFLRISWPGLRISELELPVPEEERAAKAEAAEKARAAAAAEKAAVALAALSPADLRKLKRTQAKSAASSPPSKDSEDAAAAGSAAAESPAPSPTTSSSKSRGNTSGSVSPSRRSTKQREADEAAAAAAAAAAEQERQLSLSASQTPTISTLNQPAQRAIVAARNALFARYVALVQQQAAAVLHASQQMLDAEEKARKEWEAQVHLLTNPEPLQF
jgi:hypothetical protein